MTILNPPRRRRRLHLKQQSRPVDEDLLSGLRLVVVVGSFDELAVEERRAGTHESDQVRAVSPPPVDVWR